MKTYIEKIEAFKNSAVIKELYKQLSFHNVLAADGHHEAPQGKTRRYWCPFHRNGAATFIVHHVGTEATCKRCEWSGDVVTYTMEFHGLNQSEAIDRLIMLAFEPQHAQRPEQRGPEDEPFGNGRNLNAQGSKKFKPAVLNIPRPNPNTEAEVELTLADFLRS